MKASGLHLKMMEVEQALRVVEELEHSCLSVQCDCEDIDVRILRSYLHRSQPILKDLLIQNIKNELSHLRDLTSYVADERLLGSFPKTKEEAVEYWSYMFLISPGRYFLSDMHYEESNCAFALPGGIRRAYVQCQSKAGYGPGGLYCKQHAKIIQKNIE